MKNGFLLVLFALLIATSNAAVHFTNSLILDEFDLAGKASVSLDSVCTNGCKVYVSTLKEATFIDKLTFKADDKDEVSLKSYAYDSVEKTLQKTPFVVNKGEAISIQNANENLACGPIVVYAVSNGAPNFDIAGVYDVAQRYRQEQALGKVVTVMGPEPFTIWASSPTDMLEASVYTTGFDIIEDEKCNEVYNSTRGLSIKYGVNGPITTLFFVNEVQMNVDFFAIFETELDLTSATFVTSPGFIGCGNGEVYHSSLYDSFVNFTLLSDVPRTTHLEASLNTDDPLFLRLDGNPEMERNFTGSIADASYSRSGDVSVMELSLTMTMVDPDASFLVKFTDMGLSTTEKTRRTLPPTTPTSPRPIVTKNTVTSTPATTTTSGATGTSISIRLAFLMALLFV